MDNIHIRKCTNDQHSVSSKSMISLTPHIIIFNRNHDSMQFNLKEEKTPILAEKSPKNVPRFPIEAPLVLH